MNFFSNIFQKRESVPGNESKPQVVGGSFASNVVQIGNEHASLTIPSWYRASEVLSTTMSMLVMEYQRQNKSHGGNYEIDTRSIGKRLNYLLSMQPNPTMTASQFWSQMTLHRMFEGNAVAYIDRDEGGEIKNIWMCSKATLSTTTFKYTITYQTQKGIISKADVDADEVIHWRNTFSNDHGLTGVGTLKYAINSLSLAATNDRQARDIAAKGGKHKILLKEAQKPGFALDLLNKEQKNQQQEDLQQALNESKDVLLMSGLMDAQVISQDAQAQQLLDSRKYDNTVVARYTGVPLVMLMDYSNNTYKAPEQAMQAFLQHTIVPMANSLEMEINVKLLGSEGYPEHRFHFNTNALMRLDPIGRANLGKLLLETGVKCVNELRAEHDLPKVSNGDIHYISTNLAELGSDKLRSAGSPDDATHNNSNNGEKGDEE